MFVGGNVVIPRQGNAMFLRNVVFDEATSWCPLEKTKLEDPKMTEENTKGEPRRDLYSIDGNQHKE